MPSSALSLSTNGPHRLRYWRAKPPQRMNSFSDPVYLLAYSAKIVWYQPPVGNRRLLRESQDSEPRSDDVTPPRKRFATLVASIGTLVAPRFAMPPEPVEMLTSSNLYVRNALDSYEVG